MLGSGFRRKLQVGANALGVVARGGNGGSNGCMAIPAVAPAKRCRSARSNTGSASSSVFSKGRSLIDRGRKSGGQVTPTPQAGDLGGDWPAQFRVWPDRVLVVLPRGGDRIGVHQRSERQFVAHSAVEAHHESVLCRFIGRDVMSFDLRFPRPAQDRCRR